MSFAIRAFIKNFSNHSKISLIKKNLISNYLGQGWTSLMGLIFIPFYIKYLGMEAFGLIGVFALLQVWLGLLDMGMIPALGREMARFTSGALGSQSIRDLLRSIEICTVGLAVLIALTFTVSASWFATAWLQAENLPVEVVSQAFAVMGLVTGIRFMEGVYRSSIIGLQKQVLFNILNSAMATLRGLGAVGVLAWLSPSLEAFFIWQGLISLITFLVFGVATYHYLPHAERAGRFSLEALRGIWKFSVGIIGITFLALLLTQVDKVLLSKLLSLGDYGHYTLAAIVAGALYSIISPITQAFYPRFCELHALNDRAGLVDAYHKSAQMVTVFAGSVAIVIILFAETLLRLWTQDYGLASRSATLLSLLTLGNLINGLMWIPYQMQLAVGWTSLAVRTNIIAVIFIIPAIIWVTPRYGAEGAAWVWVVLNVGYLVIGMHFMYRRILSVEKWRWYAKDIMAPLFSAYFGAQAFSFAWRVDAGNVADFIELFCALVLVISIAAISASSIRLQFIKLAKKIKNAY
jgi:O-antigen/teichoic acid export membrane protein